MHETKYVHKYLDKGNNYREISGKFGVVTSNAKVNTTGADENLFRLVFMLGHGTRVLPLELVPVPWHGAQISARTPTKGYVQAGACCPETKSEQGLSARAPSLNGALAEYKREDAY